MATSYINAAGGADYTTLTAWWTAVKDSADATETAILQSDLTGNQVCNTAGTNNKAVVIQTDGTRRTITNSGSSATLIAGAAVVTSLTIDGLTLAGGTAVTLMFSALASGGTITLKNIIAKNNGQRCFDFSAAYSTATLENCIAIDPGSVGFDFRYTTAATTNTLKHCACYEGTYGLQVANNANITINVHNSWFMGNSLADCAVYGGSVNHIYNSVTSDSSAGSAGWDSSTGVATAKTSYASYFTDPANDDFTLLDDDEALWGINSNSTYSPATDIDGTTRATYDIGPYEFAGADPPTISSVTLTGTSQIGQTLTATVVTDQDPVDSTTYQWQKAATDDAEPGTDISGETSQTLALTYADFGDLLDTAAYVRCQAIATKNAMDSDEVASAWQAVTAPSGSGVVVRIDQPVFIM